jgi:hypothetical protein
MTIPALPVPTDLAARLVGTPFLLLLDIDGTIARGDAGGGGRLRAMSCPNTGTTWY